MRCCVIGGAGFLGSHLVSALRGTGRDVLVVGRSDREAIALPPGVAYLQGDIRNRDFIADALAGTEELVDLAYSSVPKTSFENPVQDAGRGRGGTGGSHREPVVNG